MTQFPLDVERFDAALGELWPRWDTEGDGAISRAKFFRAEVGLLDFVPDQPAAHPAEGAAGAGARHCRRAQPLV